MDLDEDDIDGKRSYSIEEKLTKNTFTGDFVKQLKGHGKKQDPHGSNPSRVSWLLKPKCQAQWPRGKELDL